MTILASLDAPPIESPLVSPRVREHWQEFQAELLQTYPYPSKDDITEIRGRIDDFVEGVDCEHDFELVHSGLHYTYQCKKCWFYEAKWIKKSTLPAEEIARAQPTKHHDFSADQIYRLMMLQPFTELVDVNSVYDTGAMNYYEYLSTPEWRAIRQRVLARAAYVCEGCGQNRATIVHHLTYERRGHEFMLDLIAVCKECHDLIHGRH